MHQTHRSRSALGASLLALALVALTPSAAEAGPEPGAKRGFRLFASTTVQFEVNRVSCGMNTAGEICVSVSGSSTVPGNVWPRGTPDAYVFNSGLQIAGIIGEDGGPWAGDTTGAFFFDPKGTTQHGDEVTPIYNASDPADLLNWPEAAYVPTFADPSKNLFHPSLQGRPTASQGDIWFMTWDGNPSASAGRSHPLGVLAEVRGMAWNYPTGNEDIIYLIFTFYNITSVNEADYAAIPEARRAIIVDKAQEFQQLNEQAFGIQLPDEGYTLTNMHAAFAMDADVATYSQNYSSVNLPFGLGFSYTGTFLPGDDSWLFPASTFGPPFFAAPGFVGVKYLLGPTGSSDIQLWGTTLNQGAFDDAANVIQLWRYLSGNVSPAAGDQACTYNPVTTNICYVAPNQFDTRFFQSSPALTLAPGEFGHIAVAYIFAPPVARPGLTPSGATNVHPGDPRRINDLANLLGGGNVNLVDSVTGYLGYLGDNNDNGEPDQDEFEVVPGSLLGKSLVAQNIFDIGFLLPGAPETPDFFLVPGDNQVTVIWQRSRTEAVGDPYFQVVGDAFAMDDEGNPIPNLLYDPSYREFDVEGYRVYRGRVDNPSELELLAQFDYSGTEILDFGGYINPTPDCYLPLGLACDFVEYGPGLPADPTAAEHEPLVGAVVQVRPAGAALLADSTVLYTATDTAVTGAASGGFPALEDTGVPFLYVDNEVRNGVRYFYSVTAFDVNSYLSGDASLESGRVTKAVTPRKSATNHLVGAEVVGVRLVGDDGTELAEGALPTIDPTNGTFSGPFPPAYDSWELALGSLAGADVLAPGEGSFSVRIDSIGLGSAATDAGAVAPVMYHVTVTSGAGSVQASVPVQQPYTTGRATGAADFAAVPIDPTLAAEFGGGAGYSLPGRFEMSLPGAYYTNIHGRGCINHAAGFAPITGSPSLGCDYNGSRWFDGANETAAHPTAGNRANNSFVVVQDNFNNAGTLAGVTTIYEGRAYFTLPYWWRLAEATMGGAVRQSDIQVTWGPGGTLASVRDLTYSVDVPFDSTAGGGWGFLNYEDQVGHPGADFFDSHASLVDVLACVPPFNTLPGTAAVIGCFGDPLYLSSTAVPGPVAFAAGDVADNGMGYWDGGAGAWVNLNPATNDGFVMYIAGHLYTFELEGGALPAEGTVWTLRSYSGGVVNGGQGQAGDEGPYTYVQQHPAPLNAVGVTAEFTYNITNEVQAVTAADLADVHTVPDPYYVTNALEQTTEDKVLQFVNLPSRALIRIYSSSGVLVDVIEHESSTNSSIAIWNLRNRNEQVVASGVYFYHIEANGETKIGKFTVVNFAR